MIIRSFKNRFIRLLLILPILFSLSGCIYLVVGGVGAVGGYIVSPDTVEGITEYDQYELWEAAVEVISVMGRIDEEYEDSGILIANINGAIVTITIFPMTKTEMKLSVKARKSFLPKIDLAQEIYVKIMNYLAGI